MPPAHPARLKLRVTPRAESILRGGHPWLFSESIREQNRKAVAGEMAVIYDRKDEFLGVGLYDPDSPIRVRMLHVGKPVSVDRGFWEQRLERAIALRKDLFDASTTGHRWIHGENDGFPGLVLDRYDGTLVLKIYSPAWFPHLKTILDAIEQRLAPERIVLRLSRNSKPTESLSDRQILRGPPLEGSVLFSEHGIRFEADVLRGQKTGFFLDQRENRRLVESFSKNRRVLNAFSFSGGFSLYAARGGATEVTDLDLSLHALESARRNFALNAATPAIAACRHLTLPCDAFRWLAEAPPHVKFDLIIVDPPSLARRETDRVEAMGAYRHLARHAARLLAPDGILVSSSCSAHIHDKEFFEIVRSAAGEDRRRFTELQTTAHPPDHPATFLEAHYLKTIYLRMA